MFGPELHTPNDEIVLAPIRYDDLPKSIDMQVTEFLTDHFKRFVTELPAQYDWLNEGADNLHWGIYDSNAASLLGITGVRNLGVDQEPAISRIALFSNEQRGKGVGKLAYGAQYDYLKKTDITDFYEHAANNKNIGSLRIAQNVGFVAVHDDGSRTTMHLKL